MMRNLVLAIAFIGVIAVGGKNWIADSDFDNVGAALSSEEMAFQVGASCPMSWNDAGTATVCQQRFIGITCTTAKFGCCVAYPVGQTACPGEVSRATDNTNGAYDWIRYSCSNNYNSLTCYCTFLLDCYINTTSTSCGSKWATNPSC